MHEIVMKHAYVCKFIDSILFYTSDIQLICFLFFVISTRSVLDVIRLCCVVLGIVRLRFFTRNYDSVLTDSKHATGIFSALIRSDIPGHHPGRIQP